MDMEVELHRSRLHSVDTRIKSTDTQGVQLVIDKQKGYAYEIIKDIETDFGLEHYKRFKTRRTDNSATYSLPLNPYDKGILKVSKFEFSGGRYGRLVSECEASFRPQYSPKEQNDLYDRAFAMVDISSNNRALFNVSILDADMSCLRNHNAMTLDNKIIDDSGSPFSHLNWNCHGVVLGTKWNAETKRPWPFSPKGKHVFTIPMRDIVSEGSQLFFDSMCCYDHEEETHHIRLAIVGKGNELEGHCRRYLTSLDKWDNPFLRIEENNGEWTMVAPTKMRNGSNLAIDVVVMGREVQLEWKNHFLIKEIPGDFYRLRIRKNCAVCGIKEPESSHTRRNEGNNSKKGRGNNEHRSDPQRKNEWKNQKQGNKY